MIIGLESNPSLCLDVSENKRECGTKIQLYERNGTSAQEWIWDDGCICLKGNPKFVLDVRDGMKKRRTRIQLWERNNTESQKWELRQLSDGVIRLKAMSELCLDVRDWQIKPGTVVQLENCRENDAQRWIPDHRPVVQLSSMTPFASGASRHAFQARLLRKGTRWDNGFFSRGTRVIAKISRGYGLNLLNDVKDLREAAEWADKFNRTFDGKGPKKLRFVNSGLAPCDCYTDEGWAGVAQVEEHIEGDFEKFNEAQARAMKPEHSNANHTANFFSHWIAAESKEELMISDLQRVKGKDGYTLTDPKIHRDKDAIREWLSKHRCNEFCRRFLRESTTTSQSSTANGTCFEFLKSPCQLLRYEAERLGIRDFRLKQSV